MIFDSPAVAQCINSNSAAMSIGFNCRLRAPVCSTEVPGLSTKPASVVLIEHVATVDEVIVREQTPTERHRAAHHTQRCQMPTANAGK